MFAPFLFFTLHESSEREKNKIKSDFDKIFPVAPVATFGAFFWGEKKDLRRFGAKVVASSGNVGARDGRLKRSRGLQGENGVGVGERSASERRETVV